MRRLSLLAGALALALAGLASAQAVFIDNARVHTAGPAGTLENGDVLITDGLITAVGRELAPPPGALRIDAKGQPLTPGLFAGLTALGLEEISAESSTVHNALGAPAPHVHPGETRWRPEFDVLPAFNPRSQVIGVNRLEGLTFTVLAPGALEQGSFVAGQGGAVRLDGRFDALVEGSRSLFIDLGNGAVAASGGSRAGQYMLLDQAIREARPAPSPMMMVSPGHGLLTPAGREAMSRYLRGGRVVFMVDRAADIRQVIRLGQQYGFQPVIAGGAEAWVVAEELAAARVPVLLDALVNLPGSFDQLGARIDNAAKLHAAGVTIAFTQSGDATHNARKIRQLAGVAAANGLPWEAALAGLTANPARIFGIEGRLGSIEVGKVADLVLWNGDPLEVTTTATQVFVGGRAVPMQSRQTLLRDRYLAPKGALPRQYPAAGGRENGGP
ncbi:amidohydrolase family protein [Silanimonas lenta]|uniref:amidohydrolase family protein n=1 Tax=Silanimonas lenta TaxID=265429 RepID=UPI00040F5BFA|nr:amidohydrolase family protein [Silanimonas lenta]